MLSRILNFSKLIALSATALLFFQACDDDDDPAAGKGEVAIEITDAASDDANIEAVFVTIADVKVDGESIGMTEKQTIDLTAYANGDTKLLGVSDLEAKSYNTITLVLDNETDANGEEPGNYVLTADDSKYELTGSSSGTTEIEINNSWDVEANTSQTIVLDFDLRKAIQHSSSSSVKYQFVAINDLEAAIRVVEEDNTGTVEGTYEEDIATDADMVIVYVYNEGEFDAEVETTADSDGILFKNAVTSAKVEAGLTDTYELHFLPEGNYELVFAAYSEAGSTDQFEFENLLETNLELGGEVIDIVEVDAGVTATLSATIIGLLP